MANSTLTDKVVVNWTTWHDLGKCEVCTEPFHMDHGPLRIKRNNVPCKVIYHAILTNNKHAKREQRCSGYDNSRPGNIFHPDFLLGCPGFFDVTEANSLQPSFIIKAACQQCRSCCRSSKRLQRLSSHDDRVTAAGGIFYPLAVETLSLWTPYSL